MYLDIVILVLLLVFIAIGWRRGFMGSIVGFVSNTISFAVAIFTAKQLAQLLNTLFGFSTMLDPILTGKGETINILISGVIIYAFCALMFFVLKRFIKRVKDENKVVDKIDRFFGLVLGIAQCAVIIVILFTFVYLCTIIPFVQNYVHYIFDTGVPGYSSSIVGKFIYEFVQQYVIKYSFGILASAIPFPTNS